MKFGTFEFQELAHLTMLKQATIRLDHDGDLSPLAGLLALRSLTLPLPHKLERDDNNNNTGTYHWRSLSGLTALDRLELMRSYTGRISVTWGSQSMPSGAPLGDLTNLTCLQLHMSGLEPAGGQPIVHPSVTKLHRLAQLRVGGSYLAEVGQFPPGFGGLSALTSLTLCEVGFEMGTPLQGGLEALRVLEMADCWGPLCIDCALPALQRIGFAECGHMQLLPAFRSALLLQPDTRCEVVESWTGDSTDNEFDDDLFPDQPPHLLLQLPHLHSVVIGNYEAWQALPCGLSLKYLEDLDLLDCGLEEIPSQLGATSALRRLRIADAGIHLAITPDDLETLTALRSLTFLSVTKLGCPSCYIEPEGRFRVWSLEEHSLQYLCYILWQLRARSLVVVLKEPSNVVVSLPAAASLPADALGRCALTTGGIGDVFRRAGVAPPEPGRSCFSDEEQALLPTLEDLLPRRITPLADIAELDGAAAMWAAVPGQVSDWLQLQVDAKSRRG